MIEITPSINVSPACTAADEPRPVGLTSSSTPSVADASRWIYGLVNSFHSSSNSTSLSLKADVLTDDST